MKYLVLARRYRPQKFSDVIGQEAIITTLKNALSFDRVAHAYLFCGSRGVGKTTVARLFAKALNCQTPDPNNEPCNRCPSCLEILSGQSLDVIEIDGASNRGIDDIRQLNETIGYAPSHGKYKIYIIDEVHMLTKEAFNALLKTLEEPPERAKFFFATTEPHKVLPTIISRCQRFDMQRLTEAQISQKLTAIAEDLDRNVSSEAVHLIASFAEGSMRDAESLFDQTLCFTDGAVQAEQVRNVLGLVPDELFFELDNAFNECRVSFAFDLVDRLFQMGKDLSHFLEQLIGHYRRLTLAKTMGTPSLGLPEPLFSRIDRSIKLYTQAQLFYILETFLNSFATLQKSPMQRACLESILLHMLRSKNRIPMEVLIRRLNELEQKLSENETSAISPKIPSSETDDSQISRIYAEGQVGKIAAGPNLKNPTDPHIQKFTSPEADQFLAPSDKGKSPNMADSAAIHSDCACVKLNPPETYKTKTAAIYPAIESETIPECPPEFHSKDLMCEDKPTPNNLGQIEKACEEHQPCKTAGELKEQNAAEMGVKPVSFNPFKPRLDAKPTASFPKIEQEISKPLQSNVLSIAPSIIEPKTASGRYETLLRFAAVELEGTIKT